MKKLRITLIAITMLLFLSGCFSVTAKAAEVPYIPAKQTYFLTSKEIGYNWNLPGVKSEKYVANLKSSKKSVATVDTFSYNGTVYVGVTPKKVGKTTVSFTAKVNGKKKNYKCVVTVKKYINPFKSFKIGTVNMARKFNSTHLVDMKLSKTLKNQKVSFKLKSGWRLNWAGCYNSNNGQDLVAIKNGTKINVRKGRQIQLSLADKDGAVLDIYIYYK